MRVALCLFGQPRFYDTESYDSLKKYIIEKYNADVFFHTWWDEADVGMQYDCARWSNINKSEIKMEPNVLENLIEMYHPKRYIAEKYREYNIKDEYRKNSIDPIYAPYSLFSMYYSIKAVKDLKASYEQQHNFKYDWVVRARFDTLLKGDIPNLNNTDLIKKNQIHVPNTCPAPDLFNDNFSISSSENFDMTCNLFDHIDEYFQSGVKMGHEYMLAHHVKMNGKYKDVNRRNDIPQFFVRTRKK